MTAPPHTNITAKQIDDNDYDSEAISQAIDLVWKSDSDNATMVSLGLAALWNGGGEALNRKVWDLFEALDRPLPPWVIELQNELDGPRRAARARRCKEWAAFNKVLNEQRQNE